MCQYPSSDNFHFYTLKDLIEIEESPQRKGILIFTKIKIRLFSAIDDQSISKIKRDYSKTIEYITTRGENHTVNHTVKLSIVEIRRGKRSQSQFLTIKLKGWEYDESGFVIL